MITHIQQMSTDFILRFQTNFIGIISAKNSGARRQDQVPLVHRLCQSKSWAMLRKLSRAKWKQQEDKRKKKYDTWSQADNDSLFKLWA